MNTEGAQRSSSPSEAKPVDAQVRGPSIRLAKAPSIAATAQEPAVLPPGAAARASGGKPRARSIERYVPPPLRDAARQGGDDGLVEASTPDHREAEAIGRLLQGLAKSPMLDLDRCDTVARVVAHELGAAERSPWLDSDLGSLVVELRRDHAPDRRTLYRIGLGSIGHTTSVLRVGNRVVILQAWLGSHTLRDCLDGNENVRKSEWMAGTTGARPAVLLAGRLCELSSQLKAPETAERDRLVHELFAPHPRQLKAIEHCVAKTRSKELGLRCQWSRARLPGSPVDATDVPPPNVANAQLAALAPGFSSWTRNANGDTPLLHLLKIGEGPSALKLIPLLKIDHLEQTDHQGRSALHLAAQSCSLAIVKALTAMKCSWRAFDDDGNSPMHSLLHRKAWLRMTPAEVASFVDAMVRGGAELDAKDVEEGHGLLMRLIDHRHPVELLARVIDAGGDVDLKDEYDMTPLMWAARSGEESAVDVLLAKGADPSLRDAGGMTAAAHAQAYGADALGRRLSALVAGSIPI